MVFRRMAGTPIRPRPLLFPRLKILLAWQLPTTWKYLPVVVSCAKFAASMNLAHASAPSMSIFPFPFFARRLVAQTLQRNCAIATNDIGNPHGIRVFFSDTEDLADFLCKRDLPECRKTLAAFIGGLISRESYSQWIRAKFKFFFCQDFFLRRV